MLSLGRHALAGCAAVALAVGGLGGWAATTEIAGAVIAPGMIVTEAGSKAVQHPDGGVVAEILAEDGDTVAAGAVLVRLDSTAIAANLAVVMSQLNAAFALEARLTAESLGTGKVALPPTLSDWPERPALEALVLAQEQLRRSRAAAQAGLGSQLGEQIAQLTEQIDGTAAQRLAVEAQLAIIEEEARDAQALVDQGLGQASRRNDLKREAARLGGEAASLTAQIAGSRTAIAERRAEIAQNAASFEAQVLEDLRAAGMQIAELMQQKIAAEDRLKKLEIRAPQAGIVHESTVRTVGGVIGAGETVMRIVPQQSDFAVEARVVPLDIDKLRVGQPAVVRLSGFDVRTTPELEASVSTISPDLVLDAATGAGFYTIRLSLPPAQLARLAPGQKLVSGMPAEAFFRTADRSVLAYLLGPLTAQLSHAFRED